MKNVELLSPAGSRESAIAAIQNGCNAIYMAGQKFGARAYATNFNEEEMKEVIAYAHAYGVKIYITLNTLIREDEYDDCLSYIQFLYENKVDALIVQDLSIVSYVRENLPDFEVHASTQMHIANKEALQYLINIGVQRAVLAREVRIEEIKEWSKLPIELEVFVHGALCVAYSGQCLFSYMVGKRSGNRGECAQSCRMPYTLIDYQTKKECSNKSYLLSLKDLNTLDHIEELIESGIRSFKIEGRMKKSQYVANTTALYRKAIEGKPIDKEEIKKEKILFNREYTEGFLYHKMGSALSNSFRPNHMGIEIGEVVSYKNNKIGIRLLESINQNDGIRVIQKKEDIGFKVNRLYKDGLLVNHANKNDFVYIECHSFVKVGSKVVKTSDLKLEKEISETYAKFNRKVSVEMKIKAKLHEPLLVEVSSEDFVCRVQSEQVIEQAQNRGTSKEDIIKQLSKTKDTIFEIIRFEIDMDNNVFIPLSLLNKLRREVLEDLYHQRATYMKRKVVAYNKKNNIYKQIENTFSSKVNTEEQLKCVLQYPFSCIYVEDKGLYEKYKDHNNVYLSSLRVEKHGYKGVKMVQDIGGLYAVKKPHLDTSLNVCNSHTLHFLMQQGAHKVTFSHELEGIQIKEILEHYQAKYGDYYAVSVVVYGRVKVMVSEHCPINAVLADNDKKNCQICRKNTYALKDKFNNIYPMYNDKDCRMNLYDYKIKDEISLIPFYREAGVQDIRFDFTFEKADEIEEILANIVF